MKYIISGTNIKQVDKYTIDEVGIPSLVLMERAALSVAQEVINIAGLSDRITVVCGIGNNGADGIAVARILCCKGYAADICVIGDVQKGTKDFKKQLEIYDRVVGNKVSIQDISKGDIIVDAIFGVGLSRNVQGEYEEAIQHINDSGRKIISIDVPSGINADDANVMGCAIKADITVTFGRNKVGLLLFPGAEFAGKVKVADIGFPDVAFQKVRSFKQIEEADLKLIPKRVDGSNKGTYGKLLVIAGNDSMSGAAFLCAKSAFRMGVGMVKVLTTKGNEKYIKEMIPEVMVDAYDENDVETKLEDALRWCDSIAVGPGLGTQDYVKILLEKVLLSKKYCVIDADGINCISKNRYLEEFFHDKVIITPHIGEMARLSGYQIDMIKKNMLEVAEETASKYNIVVVLKDARTVISGKNEIYINTTGNNGMSTAGSGDVLTGIIAALISKKTEIVTAAAIGAFVHGKAGDYASKRLTKTSMMATDLIDELINITKKIEDNL